MKEPSLQLMVNGDGIGQTIPTINYPGVSIKGIRKGDSDNFLFINLHIDAGTKPGKFYISFNRNEKTIEQYPFELKSRIANSSQVKGFNSQDVICLITPDRFANGDTSNDVVIGMQEKTMNRENQGARHGGDIRGIINQLDYLKNMGYTAIWPQPLLENDMPAYSYHGYAITDHYKVDPRFGTLEEYIELSKKAKSKGIKIVFDAVLNHIGSSHWWMKDMPFKDWLNYPDTKMQTTHVRTVNQDPNASEYDRNLMTRGWFVETMPDLNGANPYLSTYLIQNTVWWIETLQLGGIRLDTYGYSIKKLLDDWTCRIMKEYPNFNIVGEEWSLNPLITSYWQTGKKNHDGYTGCLGSTMDFPLQSALVEALKQKDRTIWGKGLNILYESLANDFIYANPNQLLVFGDNHDMDRIYTQLGNDLALTKMAMTCLLTLRGIPQVYYGTEVLLENSSHPGDHGYIRADMPGGWATDKANAFETKSLTDDQLNMQAYMKKLLNWRKGSKAVTSGKTLHFAPFNDIYVYFRYVDGEKVMVIMNRNEKTATIDPKRFAEIIGANNKAIDIFSSNVFDLNNLFEVPPKSTLVLEIK
ncbi:MAG: glycoside hydrolase family 13 protein [Chitinophagaceae bacterium]|nr:glycoside hydrolase family 13 protein [Chitinophagaceae bacterium]